MMISVIMSVYNGSRYVQEAIDSILNQTFKDFEFIIIDDGSTDSTYDILLENAGADKRIVLFQNEHNIGLPEALNKGIIIASGKYIARQDADDISALNRLEVELEYAEKNGADLVGSDCYVIDMNGNTVCENRFYSKITDYKGTLLNQRAIFPHGAALIRRELLVKAGMYDPRFYYSQDGELWLRLMEHGARVHVIDQPLYYYRVLPVSTTKKELAQKRYNRVKQMIYIDRADQNVVNAEITSIRSSLLAGQHKAIVNPMEIYWKSLANTAYFHNAKKSATPYNYLRKALKESHSVSGYFNYLKFSAIYLMPSRAVKALINYK